MVNHSCQVSSFLGRSFTLNGTGLHTQTSGELDKLAKLMRTYLLFKNSVGVSKNGWTNDFLCKEWFHMVFIPQSKACNTTDAPILLILDGHGSHITKAIHQLAIDNNIPENLKYSPALPFAFTEHGVTMLASVLKSKKARKMNIAIVRAFIAMKKFALHYKELANQVVEIRQRIGEHDVQLNQIYDAIENLLDETIENKEWDERERIGFKK